jgi:hypothetical protein
MTNAEPEGNPADHDDESGVETLAPVVGLRSRDGSVPNWAPWTVLGTLMAVGLLGGLGLVPLNLPRAHAESSPGPRQALAAAAAAPTPLPSPSPSGTVTTHGELRVDASHILISYNETALGKRFKIERTQEQAKKRAEEAAARARKGEDFDKLVAEYSDDPSIKERHGKLGWFVRRAADKAFGDVAFALKPGEIGGPVLTAFGYHVILRNQ